MRTDTLLITSVIILVSSVFLAAASDETVKDTSFTTADAVHTDSASSSSEGTRKLKVIRRNYEYKRQVGVAVGMMLFIGIVMTSVQNWNPE